MMKIGLYMTEAPSSLYLRSITHN